jgi:hypothetical protein
VEIPERIITHRLWGRTSHLLDVVPKEKVGSTWVSFYMVRVWESPVLFRHAASMSETDASSNSNLRKDVESSIMEYYI